MADQSSDRVPCPAASALRLATSIVKISPSSSRYRELFRANQGSQTNLDHDNPPGGLHPGNYRFICTGETARWFCIRLNPRIGLLPYGREFVHLPPGGTVTVAAGRRLLVCDGVLNGVIGGAAGRFGQLDAVPRADHDRVFMAEGEVLGLQLWPAPAMPGQGPGDDRLTNPSAKGQKT
ncbi:MAG: hypothetical protein QGF20_09860 [Alphaproteobacteria bacterium]|nr:hypothetical protein [Alphaproteobacteria bacterium]